MRRRKAVIQNKSSAFHRSAVCITATNGVPPEHDQSSSPFSYQQLSSRPSSRSTDFSALVSAGCPTIFEIVRKVCPRGWPSKPTSFMQMWFTRSTIGSEKTTSVPEMASRLERRLTGYRSFQAKNRRNFLGPPRAHQALRQLEQMCVQQLAPRIVLLRTRHLLFQEGCQSCPIIISKDTLGVRRSQEEDPDGTSLLAAENCRKPFFKQGPVPTPLSEHRASRIQLFDSREFLSQYSNVTRSQGNSGD